MIRVIQHDGKWIIADNFKNIDTGGISGSRSHSAERTRKTFDVWTGNEWRGMNSAAMKFESEAEAKEYVALNSNRM